MICRMLLAGLRGDETAVYIPNPHLMPTMLRVAVARELGVPADSRLDQDLLLSRIQEKLIELGRAGRRVIVCLDEAQAMPDETLEALRLLTNLETEKRKLLQVVLFGQPELDHRLTRYAARQLKQRITFSYHLHPLNRHCVDAFINHRLRTAGYTGRRLFLSSAVKQLYTATGGIPRLVNVIGHKALMAAYGQGKGYVTRRHVKMAVHDTESVQPFLPRPRFRLVYGSFVAIIALSFVAGTYYLVSQIDVHAPVQIAAQMNQLD